MRKPRSFLPPRIGNRGVTTRWLVLAIFAAALVTLGVAALLTNIFERKAEAFDPFYRVVELTDSTVDPAIWGRNFPIQYDLYKNTVDMARTRYGGSEAMPRQPTGSDPRDTVAASRLVEDPRLRDFWAGYAFAEDFREERGHAYMLSDQLFTRRQEVARQPGTCLHCHASVYTVYRDAGDGDLMAGFDRVNRMPYRDAAALAEHPVACIDCHDPETMRLRVTRPGFIEGVRAFLGPEAEDDYDVNEHATRAEMRTFVCAQCHVEYYFRGPEKRLTYPWANGLRADDMLSYYEEIGFSDWTHAISDAPVLKAQHPEFEMYMQGVHARSGVACADCHMPYQRVGAMKVSDHWVRSPMLNVANACQTCHRWSEDELRTRVHMIQDRTYQLRNVAIDAVLDLARAIRSASEAEAVDETRLTSARVQQRRAQFLTDFVEAENSMGFHADQEAMRVLGLAINYARLGLAALWAEGAPSPTPPLIASPPPSVVPSDGRRGSIFLHRDDADLARPPARASGVSTAEIE
ncbi:MAG TPA: ammonia-forming cytochrome c nitrite reductase subunit c552 [Longimicrobiales bacterium]|nr:ammonia-forming cytochrome c nitrite reductase subunit c552 [Longimicrobiales bacterium]